MIVKNIILLVFSVLFLNSCALKKDMGKDLEFVITNESIKDSSFINLQINNKTTLNYYLPIINLPESEKWKHMLSSYQNRFFFIYVVAYNFNGEKKNWSSSDCNYDVVDKESDILNVLWKKKKSTLGVKDFILLKSGERINVKVPMNLNIRISKYCHCELEGYKNEKLQIEISYPEKEKELALKLLSSKTLDSLDKMGYKLYDKEIRSNKVPLIL